MKYIIEVRDIWEIGQRANQEDSLFPAHNEAKDSDRLFIVCDGMGGHESGEVASATVCEAMSQYIMENCPDAEGEFTDDNLRQALTAAFDALDGKDNNESGKKKMGTTMTFLKLHDKGCTIAHIGDSRIYHIRPGKTAEETRIMFQTRDHSLVNDLIKVGELTPEEAKTSNIRNIITRALQPHMEYRPKAEIHHTHDIRPGDYFMLCSDGVLEEFEDEHIQYYFSEEGGDIDSKVEKLIAYTENNRDNHTAYLIHIIDVIDPLPVVTENTSIDKNEDTHVDIDENGEIIEVAANELPRQESTKPTKPSPEDKLNKNIAIITTIIVFIFAIFLLFKGCNGKNDKTDSNASPADKIETMLDEQNAEAEKAKEEAQKAKKEAEKKAAMAEKEAIEANRRADENEKRLKAIEDSIKADQKEKEEKLKQSKIEKLQKGFEETEKAINPPVEETQEIKNDSARGNQVLEALKTGINDAVKSVETTQGENSETEVDDPQHE